MIELTSDQERQLRLPDQQKLVQEALSIVRRDLPAIYDKTEHGRVVAKLEEGHAAAIALGLSECVLVLKYMIYGLSAPALREVSRVAPCFADEGQNPNLLARDLFALLEMQSLG